jgi:excisionase family DNA binding protein
MKTSLEPIALTIPDAARYSGLSRSGLYLCLRTNEVASVKVGGRRLVLRSSLDAFFAKLTEAANDRS